MVAMTKELIELAKRQAMTEQFDAVLAEMRDLFAHDQRYQDLLGERFDRLAAAHAAEVAESNAFIAMLQAALYRWVPHADYSQQAGDDCTLLMGMTECPVDEPGEELRHRAEAAERDARRLDALEIDIAENGPIVLHNGEGVGGSNYRGLGMANTGRTLRAAIDACMGEKGNG